MFWKSLEFGVSFNTLRSCNQLGIGRNTHMDDASKILRIQIDLHSAPIILSKDRKMIIFVVPIM